ncbi:gliding motility-associated C-terminal domain-containing protein [Chitinophaga sp. YR627]|uniref:gliding motility-associated C-terminal domain-containing protein n=1 Tax=Chitinophaga sp. YR627 TaxID=1881041 RepID=UPI0008E111A9|nr:PKD domain-containing protein [Chitinophaga sp. YR627]SFN20903.1 gliding motility-associated C-terminal domain-containing protein [Chitinophaga sp. YR627]
MKRIFTITLLLSIYTSTQLLYAQTFTPITVTGYNADIVAEAGTDAVAVTSTVIDGSNHILHTQAFAATNGIGGGIVDNGTFVSGTRTYQMSPYTAPNALYLSANGNVANSLAAGTLTLATPAMYSKLSILAFGTENNSTVIVTLNFTDGTSSNAGTLQIKDWFFGTPFIFSGMGRLTRTTTFPTVDGLPSNPRMYSFDFNIPCADQSKLVSSVSFLYVQGPNISSRALIVGLSGESFTPLTYTSTKTDAVCGGASGSIAVTATGGSQPLSYSWNTTPVQTTPTATGLAGGTYTLAIRDANNCVTNVTATVEMLSTATLTATATPTQICAGETSTLSVTASGGTVINYSWTPGAGTGNSITVTPADTTAYIVSAQDQFGCTVRDTVEVAVKPTPVADFSVLPDTVCLGTGNTLTFTGTAGPAATYNWHNFAGATVQSGTGVGPYDIRFNAAGQYPVQLQITEDGCVSAMTTHTIVVSQPPIAAFTVSKTPVCAGESITITYTGSNGPDAVPTWNWGGGAVRSGTGYGPYMITYERNGTITFSIQDGVCADTAAPVAITAIPIPVPDFSTDLTTACAPQEISFTNLSQLADSYTWSLGNGTQTTEEDPVCNYTVPGVYTVSLTASSQGLCTRTITKTALINILTPPVAAFSAAPGENVPVEFKNGSFTFNNTSENAVSYSWDFGDGNSADTEDAQHKYELPGSYRVTLYAANEIGCTDSISHAWYIVTPDLVLEIPNVFSPNGDGINDNWSVDGLKARPMATTEIYNRWGQIVFTGIGYTPWDGTRRGQPLPVGTYYYVIKTSADEKPYTGWVALLR